MFDGIDMDEVLEKLKELVLKAAKQALPGPQKMKQVVKEGAAWLATKIKTPLGDTVETLVFKFALTGLAQLAYGQLKKAGQV